MPTKAFVFDTNFIIQNQQLNEVIDKLKDQYCVYVTQVAIDERIAQNCRDLRARFDEAEKCKDKFAHFATITFKTTFEEESKVYQKGIQEKYEHYFGDFIIPFSKDADTFSAVIDRANKRLPPFSNAKEASDKGFKDCLLWLSLMDYFKTNGENEIVFVTDDNAFRNNADELSREFKTVTGKTIEIKPNSYYKEILQQQEEIPTMEEEEELPNFEVLRNEIDVVINSLRGIEDENYFGDPEWSQTFTTSIPFDKTYVEIFFASLRSEIKKHIFEQSVPATDVLELDSRITNGDAEIPMGNLEKALQIYENVRKKYPQYTDQFFETVARILNRSYKPTLHDLIDFDDDGDLPF